MLATILELDKKIFLALNHFNSDLIDPLMLFLSYNYIPGILMVALFSYKGVKRLKSKFIFALIALITTFSLSDSISTKVFKNNIKRLRPMHEPSLLGKVYTAKQGRGGGKYGFVSSHASNTFALSTFIILFLFGKRRKARKLTFAFYLYAFGVSYSRIYLGKHYPLDIICGAVLGIMIAIGIFKLWKLMERSLLKLSQDQLQ